MRLCTRVGLLRSSAHTLHREPVLITELCDTDVTEITELLAEEAIKEYILLEFHKSTTVPIIMARARY